MKYTGFRVQLLKLKQYIGTGTNKDYKTNSGLIQNNSCFNEQGYKSENVLFNYKL